MEDLPILDSKFRWYKIRLKNELLQPEDFYFRGITRKELRIAGLRPSKFDADTYILETVVNNRKNWLEMVSGTADRLLSMIYKYSGLDQEGDTFREAISWIQSESGAMEAAAVCMIPGCTLETLDTADPYNYAKYLALGKFSFESIYRVPVETAFLPKSEKEGVAQHHKETARPNQGEVGYDVETFNWSRS